MAVAFPQSMSSYRASNVLTGYVRHFVPPILCGDVSQRGAQVLRARFRRLMTVPMELLVLRRFPVAHSFNVAMRTTIRVPPRANRGPRAAAREGSARELRLRRTLEAGLRVGGGALASRRVLDGRWRRACERHLAVAGDVGLENWYSQALMLVPACTGNSGRP